MTHKPSFFEVCCTSKKVDGRASKTNKREDRLERIAVLPVRLFDVKRIVRR